MHIYSSFQRVLNNPSLHLSPFLGLYGPTYLILDLCVGKVLQSDRPR